MFRTRFKKEIVAEFLPPARPSKRQQVIILCDGMPSIPRKQALAEYLSTKGYWVFYPRWRGAWESGGQFLERSPHEDILDIVSELPNGFQELAFGRKFRCSPDKVFVIGGSFGGAAAILSSLDPRITKVIANCPVVDWAILPKEQKKETSNPSYPAYIRAVRQRIPALREELEQTTRWRILQSRASCEGSHCFQDINVSRQGRPLYSLENCSRVCQARWHTAKTPLERRSSQDGICRSKLLAPD
jgi:alpha-beta hydrolase superfamily lysophospholipase